MLETCKIATEAIFTFLFGTLNPTLSAFFLFAGIVLIISYIVNKKTGLKYQFNLVGIYLVLIIISHHIDIIIINNIAPAEDTTRMFVIILMSARLLREIFTYIQAGGVSIPRILTLSVDKMEELDSEPNIKESGRSGHWNEDEIEEQIAIVRKKIKELGIPEDELNDKLGIKRGGKD